MRIIVCHERFLFRFGADRHFMLTARGLRELGHSIVMVAQRFDESALSAIADRVIAAPSDGRYEDLDDRTADWLDLEWDQLFRPDEQPDAAIIGGWPFHKSISVMESKGVRTLFSDVGVTPSEGQPDTVRLVQDRIRALRQRYLPTASAIIPNSDFIAQTQSRPDAGSVRIKTIYPGVDHFSFPVWRADQVGVRSAGRALSTAERLKGDGRKVIFAAGRWEESGYKNSGAAIKLLEGLVQRGVDAHLLILSEEAPSISEELLGRTHCLGFPDDVELRAVMETVDLCVSVSLWEGFNLSLGEAQWLGRFCLVFRCGAHPEVVAHPWLLSADLQEMTDKAAMILSDSDYPREELLAGLDAFRKAFSWENHAREYERTLASALAASSDPPLILVHANNAAIDPANSGVVRVTRRLGRTLQESGRTVAFLIWDADRRQYVMPSLEQYGCLATYHGPQREAYMPLSAESERPLLLDQSGLDLRNAVLLIPEIVPEELFRGILSYARKRGLPVAAIYYDAIPLLKPEYCSDEVVDRHRGYQDALASCDEVLAISRYSADCLQQYWRANGLNKGSVVQCVLPGEFGGGERLREPKPATPGQVRILCVSTLEPRKNHRKLLEAFRMAASRAPSINWSLTLIGNRYAGAEQVAKMVERQAGEDRRVRWLGVVDDAALRQAYIDADFTVYPSEIEGYGLPIAESLWHARPCICSNGGVMAEIAEGGGCLTVDVHDTASLAEGIERLATNEDLRRQLGVEAAKREIRSWTAYGADVCDRLDPLTAGRPKASLHGPSLEHLLYPRCRTEKWQMADSERLAFTGLLARLKPGLSIEIGSYWGGSLSLLAQFSNAVISVDVDLETPGRCGAYPNVTYLIGDSADIVPRLLRKLQREGVPVEFILIDADHTAEGVRGDIRSVLSYRPEKPMVVLLHDAYNPDCRRGMLEAGWEESPYCHEVNLDLVPGRMVEDGGPFDGELWGGLAVAYFKPQPRSGQLMIRQSAHAMLRRLSRGARESESASQ